MPGLIIRLLPGVTAAVEGRAAGSSGADLAVVGLLAGKLLVDRVKVIGVTVRTFRDIAIFTYKCWNPNRPVTRGSSHIK